jgi:hypothetical protein
MLMSMIPFNYLAQAIILIVARKVIETDSIQDAPREEEGIHSFPYDVDVKCVIKLI